MTGEVLTESDAIPCYREVAAVCARFIGPQTQVPPMYSAVKIDGRKLVDLAREGKEIERSPREIAVKSIHLTPGTAPGAYDRTPPEPEDGFSADGEPDSAVYREYTLDIVCSKGTYIRTLCADMGKTLGCGGAMATLCRVRSGGYTLDGAYTTDALNEIDYETLLTLPEPVETLFPELPEVYVNDFFRKLVVSGTPLYQKKLRVSIEPGSLVRLKTRTESGGQFFAIGKADTDESGEAVLRLEKLFIL